MKIGKLVLAAVALAAALALMGCPEADRPTVGNPNPPAEQPGGDD